MVVIIGIVTASVVSVTLTDRWAEHQDEEARRLMALVKLAQEEAVLESRLYALGFWQNGYGFYIPAEEGWTAITRQKDKKLGARTLPDGMEFDLYLEDIDVILDIEPPEKPQVFILSSGEMTAFSAGIRVTDSDRDPVNIAFDPLGRVQTESDG